MSPEPTTKEQHFTGPSASYLVKMYPLTASLYVYRLWIFENDILILEKDFQGDRRTIASEFKKASIIVDKLCKGTPVSLTFWNLPNGAPINYVRTRQKMYKQKENK